MSSQKVPVIDLSMENLKHGTTAWVSACKEIKDAFEESGCFVAVYNKAPMELHKTLFSTVQELFDLPLEVKIKNTNEKPFFGYRGQFSFNPLYESLGIDNPTTLEGTQSFTKLMWPAGNVRFCQSILSITKTMEELNEMVVRMLFESYGVERDADSYIRSMDYLLRTFAYRVPKENDSRVGVNPHVDMSLITVLYQSLVDGLQIKTKDDEWIEVGLSPSSFLVLAGDALMAWSNDRILHCYHKVMMLRTNEPRYSLGLFANINGTIQAPGELEDEEHPLKYKPFEHFDYLRRVQSEVNKTPEFYLKDSMNTTPKCFLKEFFGV